VTPLEAAAGPGRAPIALLVDDDDDLSRAFTRALEHQGFVVHRSRTGTDALAQLAHVPQLDAAIVDLVLPGAGGLEVVRQVRATFPGCRIVAVTGLAEAAMDRAFHEAGADVFLAKPVELQQLFEALRAP
jgi:OmpR-family two-component system manganese-sensing response regulator